MSARLRTLWEQLRTNFWVIPSLMVLGAAILAFGVVAADRSLNDAGAGLEWIYNGGPDGARSILSAIASSVISVAGTTFSITIAALSLASGQFGPRLLRNFVRDTGNQIVLGTFVATFLYCLLVIRTIRSAEEIAFVPHLAVTLGVLLAVASVAVLIYFINHIVRSIQADHVIAAIGSDFAQSIDDLFPHQLGRGIQDAEPVDDEQHLPDDFARHATRLSCRDDGYLQVIDTERLLAIATEHNLRLKLPYRPGHFVGPGGTLAHVWPGDAVTDDVRAALRDTFVLGPQRSNTQDVEFSALQLVEIGVRALSPGTNDPFTAMSCLDRLGAGLVRIADRPIPGPRRYDSAGRLRVVANPVTFEGLVNTAFDQIRHYGAADTAVTIRMLEILAMVMHHTDMPTRQEALLRQARMIARASEREIAELEDRATIAARYQDVVAAAGVPANTL